MTGKMKRSVILVLCIIFSAILSVPPANAQTGAIPGIDQPYWQQDADYLIKCLLDHGSHRLTGAERIRYTNNSPDTLTEFYLHLYPNAYKEKDSQLLKDFLAGVWFQFIGLPKKNRGWIEIDSFAII